MGAKLIIDLAKCKPQGESKVECSYKHHPENKGFDSLLEMIRFALICRKCYLAPCITACPRRALEKVPSKPASVSVGNRNEDAGALKRANMLCTGCGSCAMACPFGTIYPDLIPFPSSVCDVCRGRLAPGEKPLCVRTCRNDSIDYREAKAEGDMVEVFDDIVVKVAGGTTWQPFTRETKEAKR